MSPKRLRLSDLDSETFETENSEAEVTEMAIPFVRGHYSINDSSKALILFILLKVCNNMYRVHVYNLLSP